MDESCTTPAVACPTTAAATSAGVEEGFRSRYSAATPVTCGVAIDVPDQTAGSGPESDADGIFTPGANRSRQRPQFVKSARQSRASVAPTVIASGSLAGEKP